MVIRYAGPDDINSILALRDAARLLMRASGNMHQWPDGTPSQSLFESDIAKGFCHIIEAHGLPTATFSLLPSPDPTYVKVFDGPGWRNPEGGYGVIHRLASDGTSRGIFNAVFDYAKNIYSDLRIDTHKDNSIMRHCLEKNGFAEVGTIFLKNQEPRLAYQWLRTGLQ